MQLNALLSMFLVIATQTQNFTLEDLLGFKCDKGNQQACDELVQIAKQKKQIEFLDSRVESFSQTLENKQLMLDDKRPNLEAAYPLVMTDYFVGLHHTGKLESIVSESRLAECAGHYHNFWINKKLWWPNDAGKPDWESIYVFIVDHYFGFCLKTL